jgi:hypothetical protein
MILKANGLSADAATEKICLTNFFPLSEFLFNHLKLQE